MKASLLGIAIALSACSGTERSGIEANTAGIDHVEINRTANGVTIAGFAENAQIVSATLFRGEVDFAPDIGEPTERVAGRSLTVDIAGESAFEHVSPGDAPLLLPLPRSPIGAAFLELQIVREALYREGIELQPRPEVEEQAYETGTYPCGGCNYTPSSACGATACGTDAYGPLGAGNEKQWVCCGNSGLAVDRLCGLTWCGPLGPNGCAVCWTSSYSSYCSIWNEDVCQFQWN
jgi:hypothetical protein